MSDETPTPETPADETPKLEKKSGVHPLAIAAALVGLLFLASTAAWYFSRPAAGDQPTAEATEPPATTPGESPVAKTITPGPVTVAVNDEVRLAPVTIKRQDYLCAVVTFDKDVIEGVDLTWPNKSSKERWEICGTDLKKEGRDDHGAWSLTVGGRRIKLSEVIVTNGDYTALASTPGALARCWGEGQVNGDGQPACTPKPAATPNVVAEAAPAAK